MKYRCDVMAKNVDLTGFPMEMAETIDGEPDMVHSDAVVHFDVEFEERGWGIKHIIVSVSMIVISVGDHELGIIQFEPSTIDGVNDDQWVIEELVDFYDKLAIYPVEVELDWEKKKAYVNF